MITTTTPDSIDRPPLYTEPIPDFAAMSRHEFDAWIVAELLRCRLQLAEEETRLAGIQRQIAALESREREREGDGR